jgi:hypothetical protein
MTTTAGSLLGVALLLGIWGYGQDSLDKEKEEEDEDDDDHHEGAASPDRDLDEIEEEETRIRKLIKKSLPAYARVRTFWKNVIHTLKDKYDWSVLGWRAC